jgi:hypothetical protein
MLFEDRSRAESFGNVAQLYDRARPTYPLELVDWLLSDGARMAAIAQTKGLDVEVASFERWDDRGRRFELAVSAQAWHWIEPRAGAGKAAAVLSDGGRIACFWNLGDPPADVRERLAPVYDRLAPELENYSVVLRNSERRSDDTAAALNDSGLFEPAEIRRFGWSRAYSTDEWLQFIATHSDHQALGEQRLGGAARGCRRRDRGHRRVVRVSLCDGARDRDMRVTGQVCSASHGYRAVSLPA